MSTSDGSAEAVRRARSRLDQSNATDPARPDLSVALQSALFNRSHLTKDVDYLQEAIKIGEELRIRAPGHRNITRHLHIQGKCFFMRFSSLGSIDDLKNATACLEAAFKQAGEDYLDKTELTENLSQSLHNRYRQLEDIEDLTRAINLGNVTVRTADVGSLGGKTLSNLANAYNDRYEDLGNANDLAHAIRLGRSAIEATAEHDGQLAHRQQCLGTALYDEFRRAGVVSNLEQAISYWKMAYEKTSEIHSEKARRSDDLGAGLFVLFGRNDHLNDLSSAIKYCETAVQLTPKDHEERAERVGNLAMGLRERYKRVGVTAKADLERAIDIGESALPTISEKHQPGLLNQVADTRYSRYLSTHFKTDARDLSEALRCWRLCVNLTPGGSVAKGERCQNLGTALNTLYYRSRELPNLEEAIRFWEESVEATPENHPGLSSRLYNTGIGYSNLNLETKLDSHKHKARSLFEESLHAPNGAPLERVEAGIRAAIISLQDQDLTACVSNLEGCIDLLPTIVPPTKSQDDLQYVLRQLGGLGSQAAFVFLEAGKTAFEALEALEKCRGVIASLTIDLRSDVSSLAESHPTLASEYQELRAHLSQSAFSHPETHEYHLTLDYATPSLNRMHNIRRLEGLLLRIRAETGFERFQLPPTRDELMKIAQNGPAVCFNVSENDPSHAFLLTNRDLKVIELPKLSLQDVKTATTSNIYKKYGARNVKLKGRTKEGGDSPDWTLTQSMLWLWDAAVRPVLSELNLMQDSESVTELPCIWWVGGGLMALLPMHAAGDHAKGSKENTLSHVISSYAPSLKALQFSQSKGRNQKNDRILLIAMHKTAGQGPLKLENEIRAIETNVGPSTAIDILKQPSAATVLERIPDCSIVHFACHASSDASNPSNSSLYLGSPTTVDRLKISDLQPLSNQLAQVAYLSACSTAEIGARNLVDESIHLASTFQLVGFRHVIGTLWPAHNDTAVDVAAGFYENLQNGRGALSVAQALHKAVCDKRVALDEDPENLPIERKIRWWAPFIHQGP